MTQNNTANQTQTAIKQEGFLTTSQMMDYYPLLTVIFDVAFNTLKRTPMDKESIQQLKLETDTFHKMILSQARSFSDDYESLPEAEQETQCKQVGSMIFFASVMNLLAQAINHIPTTESNLN